MGPLPTGSHTDHIMKSQGADTNIMKFYITQNSSTYGKHWQNFKPRTGRRQTGTGYSANFRPQVYYSTELDKLDNPVMGMICSTNYHTVTELSFQPYKENSGREPLPNSVHQVGTGFVRQKPITNPTEHEAKSVFIDTRAASAPANILPHGKPLLRKLQPKDPVELDNHGYGPSYMVTETKQRFQGKQNPVEGDLSTMTIGPNTETGFTDNLNIEPITYYPNNPHLNDQPGWYTMRPTGVSVTKTSFHPWKYPKGNEPIPNIASPSERGSGFTHIKPLPLFIQKLMGDAYDRVENTPALKTAKVKKGDPMEYLNMTHPNNLTSTVHDQYTGQQRPTPTEADRLSRTMVGWKEMSGYSDNNYRYVHQQDDPRRFITHYMTRFTDDNPKGKWREGHTRGGVQRQKKDGYTKSTQVHSNGPDIDTTQNLRSLDPYVARSIKARDRFYDDHTNDSKNHKLAAMA